MDIRQTVTDKIIALLERGTTSTGPRWTGGKATGLPTNAKTGEAYHGINVLLLWAEMAEKTYSSSQWLTYKQAADMGGQVRKGEKSVLCVYYQTVQKQDDQPDDAEKSYFLAKPFWLFNLAQIDGLPLDLVAPATVKDFDASQEAEQVLIKTHAQIHYGFDSAYYATLQDKICMPQRARFTTSENFYATVLHELTHWTGHESRLNRQFGKRFGDDAYAFEELVAELGAAFTVGQLGMLDATIEAHADYVQGWVRVLKNDKGAIFTAASQAAKAANYIFSC
jgi:antirestriction protein ArdC